MNIKQTSNAGFLLSLDNTAILLDGVGERIAPYFETPIYIKEELLKVFPELTKLIEKNYDINTIDGVRATFSDGWALVRCSNTGPNITARFEAKTKEELENLQNEFISLINEYKYSFIKTLSVKLPELSIKKHSLNFLVYPSIAPRR